MDIIFNIIKYIIKYRKILIGTLAVLVITALTTKLAAISIEEPTNMESIKYENTELKKEVENLKAAYETLLEISTSKDQVIDTLKKEKIELEETNSELKEQINLLHTMTNKEVDPKYSHAVFIWNYLKAMGFNDYVAAGIIGNMMAEVGGHTLDFRAYAEKDSHDGYYGICQWGGARRTRLLNNFGTTVADQCRFLSIELYEVIPKGSNFYNLQNEQEAALYFAKYYERCHSDYYYVRQLNATKAYEYFVGK